MHKVVATYKVKMEGQEYIFDRVESGDSELVQVHSRTHGVFGFGLSLEQAIEDAFHEAGSGL